jgi:hypothetical protein
LWIKETEETERTRIMRIGIFYPQL